MATILYIEDEADTAVLVTGLLKEQGIEVRHAADGRQALHCFQTMPPPALVLLDLLVPFANGFELLIKLRATSGWANVPVVMVSADSYWPDIERALVCGANDFLPKSMGVHEIVRYVAGLVARARAAAEAAAKAPMRTEPVAPARPQGRPAVAKAPTRVRRVAGRVVGRVATKRKVRG